MELMKKRERNDEGKITGEISGLHKKDKRKGIYIVSRTFVRDRKK